MRKSRAKWIRNGAAGVCLSGLAALMMGLFSGCAAASRHAEEKAPSEGAEAQQPASGQSDVPNASKRFEEPGELDKMLDAKPIALAAVKPASQSSPTAAAAPKSAEPTASAPSKGKGNFRIQVGAESDLDAAQAKKAEYEKMLGGAVDVTFDAPYYKLRWGFFDTKQDAEDKLLELSDLKIQGFVVKQ